ncbi:MAG: acyltransferase domain-containing protein [Eubacteriales bacterium]|nr:acyltransferase domain-containing protein [Eubacteriales bacterium]
MTNERFAALLRHCGPIAPEGAERFIADLAPDGEPRLFDHSLLEQVLRENHVPEDRAQALRGALHVIEQDEELVELSRVLSRDAHRAHNRAEACEYEQPLPVCLEGFPQQAFPFLFALACTEQGRRQLRERGVPEEYDADIPERMIRKQLRKFVETGDISFDDFPWDIGFYSAAIFFLDRFYFIPYLHSAPEAWRNSATGEVVALWPAGERIRRDGQLDGVNGVFDPDAFTTTRTETDELVSAHPVDPRGLVLPQPVALQKGLWRRVLGEGDYLLALHIPGGEGYTPERVRSSCEAALAFYDKYFPELHIKGFWSESWLYDPGLSAVLRPDSRILQVQRQFYCYPTPEGEEMIKLEVFGTDELDPAAVECSSSLQKNLCAAWLAGAHFHTTGMFLLREEVARVGSAPYRA